MTATPGRQGVLMHSNTREGPVAQVPSGAAIVREPRRSSAHIRWVSRLRALRAVPAPSRAPLPYNPAC